MSGRPDASVFVEAPSRLHFGVLDLHGGLGRRFGGMGAAIPTPSLLVEAARAADVEVEGPDAERGAGGGPRAPPPPPPTRYPAEPARRGSCPDWVRRCELPRRAGPGG
jgi:hypothetical protein